MASAAVFMEKYLSGLKEFGESIDSIMEADPQSEWTLFTVSELVESCIYPSGIEILSVSTHVNARYTITDLADAAVTRVWMKQNPSKKTNVALVSVPYPTFTAMLEVVYNQDELWSDQPASVSGWDADSFSARLDDYIRACISAMQKTPINVTTF